VAELERPSANHWWPEMFSGTSALNEAVAKNEALIQDLLGKNAELGDLLDACASLASQASPASSPTSPLSSSRRPAAARTRKKLQPPKAVKTR
jgi:hypothetical protein